MSVPNPMTREELLELSALDALGLLEEYEAALFTRSFHHAPAAVTKTKAQPHPGRLRHKAVDIARFTQPVARDRIAKIGPADDRQLPGGVNDGPMGRRGARLVWQISVRSEWWIRPSSRAPATSIACPLALVRRRP